MSRPMCAGISPTGHLGVISRERRPRIEPQRQSQGASVAGKVPDEHFDRSFEGGQIVDISGTDHHVGTGEDRDQILKGYGRRYAGLISDHYVIRIALHKPVAEVLRSPFA